MSWSLNAWSINPRAEDALSALGRALHIATRFEDKCKYLLRSANLASAYESSGSPTVDLDDLLAQVPKDLRLLGRTIEGLGKIGPMSAEDAEILKEAKNARNWIAHESASIVIHDLPGPVFREAIEGKTHYDLGALVTRLEETRQQLRLLTRGENLVSRWCFYMEEGGKEPAPSDLIERYASMVEHWVFAPVSDLLPMGQPS